MHGRADEANMSSSVLGDLNEEQTERLSEVLDQYLASLEAGQPLAQEALLADHADLCEPLGLYLQKLNELHHFSSGFPPSPAGALPRAAGNSIRGNATQRDSRDATPSEASARATTDEPISPELLHGLWDNEPAAGTARRLGDFELLRVVGRGGMGIVYEAQQLSLRRRVALKLLPFSALLDSRQIQRFKNEAQAAAALQHPNIVPVYAIGSYQGVHYYAMALIDGYPLDAIIGALRHRKAVQPAAIETPEGNAPSAREDLEAAEGWELPTDARRVISLGIEAASALAAAHEEGIIHRDIKPSNLLLDKSGKLWVTDFGLARRVTDHSLTATGDVLGTLRYMSPEQASGQAALVDARSDVYSLGITLYELLTLVPAVTGASSPGLMRAIEQQQRVSIRHLRPDLPRDLVTVLETAMARNPYERYLTAQHFADDLVRVLEGRPVLAKPPTLLTRAARWAARHRRLVSVAAIVLCLACLGLGVSTWTIAHKNAVAQKQAESAQKAWNGLRQTVDQSYSETAEDLKDVAGAEAARRRLLTKLLGYYRQFVTEFRDYHGARADVASALVRLGTLHSELGDQGAARSNLREAHSLYQALVVSDPANLDYQRRLAVSANELGRVLVQIGKTKEANASAREAVELQEKLILANPENVAIAVELAQSRNNLALLLADTGNRNEAERLLHAAREDLVKLTTDAPDNREQQQLLAATYNNLCSVIGGRDPAAAVRLYQLSLDVQQRVVDEASDEPKPPRRQMAITFSNLGKSLVHAGQLDEAADAYQSAITIQRQLLAVAPSHRAYIRDLSVSLNNLGLAAIKQRHWKEAEASFREAIELQQRLIEQTPADATAAHDLGGTFNNLATLLQAFPDLQAIDAAFQQAIAYQRQAHRAAPSVQKYREFLDNHLRNYSAWLQQTHRDEPALAAAIERRILWSGNAHQLLLVASDLADAALDIAGDSNRQGVAQRYADAALETLSLAHHAGLARSRGLTLQQLLSQQPFSSLARITSPTD